jgi:hypothetical protein
MNCSADVTKCCSQNDTKVAVFSRGRDFLFVCFCCEQPLGRNRRRTAMLVQPDVRLQDELADTDVVNSSAGEHARQEEQRPGGHNLRQRSFLCCSK